MIIKAEIQDQELLTTIALQSKAYWGYSEEQIEKWREDLTVKPKMFEEWRIYKYLINDTIGGFYILNRTNLKTSILEFLFVVPNFINQGIGSKLLEHVKAYCKKEFCTVLNVLADPNAESFYLKHGFRVINKQESSIKGRFLPEMELLFPENM
ncbi:GNAT family N-acetyltransferase [Tenacibaculum sp.]|uniref:GNAT family N-acetyltransferase n=1 Tax=Tenacibaculum sp. TaxID=1906242 RepID=UPI003D116CFB